MDYKHKPNGKERNLLHDYQGISYPTILYRFWKLFNLCKKNYHLFDEVYSHHLDGTPDHYLSCDVCGYKVTIDSIEID